MEGNTIGLIAAMPQEVSALLAMVGVVHRETRDGFRFYRFSLGSREISLILSGVGRQRAAAATALLVETAKPALMISFGFAGGVRPGLRAGDLVLARRTYLFQEGDGMFVEYPVPYPEPVVRSGLADRCQRQGIGLYDGTVITVDRVCSKPALARILPPDLENPVLDMETKAVVAAARAAAIPVYAIRGISDGAHEELAFDVSEFTSAAGIVRPGKVLAAVVRHPGLVPQLIRLARNSRLAATSLGHGVAMLAALL